MPAPAAASLTSMALSRMLRSARPPEEAIRICARDLAVAEADLAILPQAGRGAHYKSDIFYVGSKASRAPLYVVKLDRNAYDAPHEAQALEFAARILGQTAERSENRLGAVRPVGWGVDPQFLVTRYQPGELAQRAVDRAVLRWWAAGSRVAARSHAQLMARWLGVFRARATRPDGGLDPSEFLDEVRERAMDCAKTRVVDSEAMRLLLRRIEDQLRQLGVEDVARMRQSYPNRGDARPKNFLFGTDGVLYALDMEGFGFGPMEHDISCLHHALEYEGARSPAAGRRADELWRAFWREYMQHGSSPAFALLGYVYFLLERMRKSAHLAEQGKLGRRLRTRIWFRNRLLWLASLSGDLQTDVDHMEQNV